MTDLDALVDEVNDVARGRPIPSASELILRLGNAVTRLERELADKCAALQQATDGSVELQAKVDRLERELAEARGHAAHCEMERNAAMARSGALEQEADRLRAALETAVTALAAVDAYWTACTMQWARNDGRLVTDTGTLIEGSDEVERLCDEAALLCPPALSVARRALAGEETP